MIRKFAIAVTCVVIAIALAAIVISAGGATLYALSNYGWAAYFVVGIGFSVAVVWIMSILAIWMWKAVG